MAKIHHWLSVMSPSMSFFILKKIFYCQLAWLAIKVSFIVFFSQNKSRIILGLFLCTWQIKFIHNLASYLISLLSKNHNYFVSIYGSANLKENEAFEVCWHIKGHHVPCWVTDHCSIASSLHSHSLLMLPQKGLTSDSYLVRWFGCK